MKVFTLTAAIDIHRAYTISLNTLPMYEKNIIG